LERIFVTFGRVGYCARGFVWCCIGGVAISGAFTGNQTEGPTGAIGVVTSTLGGWIFLIPLVVGILCYSLWRLFEGIYGARTQLENQKQWKKLLNGYIIPFCSGIFYFILGVGVCFVIRKGPSEKDSTSEMTLYLSKTILGRITLNFMAAVLILVAGGWSIQLINRTFVTETVDRKKLESSPKWLQRMVYSTAYIGTSGRIILFVLLAILLFRVAWDPDIQYLGFGGALAQIQTRGPGMFFLFLVGLLLVIFGVWSVLGAYFRSFLPQDSHPDQISDFSSYQTLQTQKTFQGKRDSW